MSLLSPISSVRLTKPEVSRLNQALAFYHGLQQNRDHQLDIDARSKVLRRLSTIRKEMHPSATWLFSNITARDLAQIRAALEAKGDLQLLEKFR